MLNLAWDISEIYSFLNELLLIYLFIVMVLGILVVG